MAQAKRAQKGRQRGGERIGGGKARQCERGELGRASEAGERGRKSNRAFEKKRIKRLVDRAKQAGGEKRAR